MLGSQNKQKYPNYDNGTPLYMASEDIVVDKPVKYP